MKEEFIKIRGARVHNLKNINLDIPKNKLVVITGLSGSGKSSLAFDTLYAEGQRRYVESLSAYARQFLGVMDKPDVDKIEGISPAISIDQRKAMHNPRSTVGTITEIYDYLRLLYARIGKPHCPNCGKLISRQTVDQIVEQVLKLPGKSEFAILGPVIRSKKGEHRAVLEEIQRSGFVRVRIDGKSYVLEEIFEKESDSSSTTFSSEKVVLDKQKKHDIEVVVDRLILNKDLERSRLVDSLETALKLGKGTVIVSGGAKSRGAKAPPKKVGRFGPPGGPPGFGFFWAFCFGGWGWPPPAAETPPAIWFFLSILPARTAEYQCRNWSQGCFLLIILTAPVRNARGLEKNWKLIRN